MKASELAYKAAQEMSQRGHCKKVTENTEGQVCLYGALSRAEGLPAPQKIGNVQLYKPMQPLTVAKMDGLLAALTAAPLSGMTLTTHTTAALQKEGFIVDVTTSDERALVTKVISDILQERGFADWRAPHLYNDQDDITGEDVILLFKEAGARLEAEGK